MFTITQHLSFIQNIFRKLSLFVFQLIIQKLFNFIVKMEADVNHKPKKKSNFGIKILKFQRLKYESQEGPKGRSGHRMTVDENGNLYILGGYNSDIQNNDLELENDEVWQRTKPLFEELWKFNITTNKWIKVKTTGKFPKQLASHCCELFDDIIISYGGTAVPFEQFSSNNLYICNLNTAEKKWCLLNKFCKPESQFPTDKYGQAMCSDFVNSKIYVSGGTDGFHYCMDIHCFNFKEKLWTQLSSHDHDSPEARYRHEMTLYDNKLYIFGGGYSNVDLDCGESLPVFDLRTCQWSTCQTNGDPRFRRNSTPVFPRARRCHIICRYKDFIFLLGGLSQKKLMQDLWKFDLRTKNWTLLCTHIPIPCYFHAATCSIYGQLTFFGGITTNPSYSISYRSKKLFSIWIDIPPLKEMAWRALLYYTDNFKNSSTEELTKMGLLSSYIKRLED